MHELSKELEILLDRTDQAMDQLDIAAKKQTVVDLETEMASPDFWNDSDLAATKSKEHADLKDQVNQWQDLRDDIAGAIEMAELEDHSLLKDLEAQHEQLKERFEKKEFEVKLSGKYDKNDAIIHIHSGTGGTDAQDWAQMLERMYLKYGEKTNLESEVISESVGDEAGIKSAILRLSGLYAYGRLQSEHGVHRLVRLSPFNADNLRQTSFALVEVTPDISEPKDIEIDEKDLRVDVYRAGGKGGQSVNTTDSAVRITHIPTNITVAIQNERSQLQNKEAAMKVLRARLAQLQHEQHEEAISKLKGPSHTQQWGQQIRNYVLHPYTLVKDTRTNFETNNVDRVLDGDLDDFIDAYLTYNISS
ncbi:MAG: peptide chain release factor 2 [Candidatus Saccharimonadales bacterium]